MPNERSVTEEIPSEAPTFRVTATVEMETVATDAAHAREQVERACNIGLFESHHGPVITRLVLIEDVENLDA